MAKSRAGKPPAAKPLDALVEFFDANDMGDLWERMPEARFDVDIKSRTHLVALDGEVATRLTEVAKAKRTSSEELVNAWLKEKLAGRKDAR